MSYAKKYGSRYNFDRVMHDHRYVPDVHVKSHVPFTTVNYFNGLKYTAIFALKRHPQLVFGVLTPVICIGAWFVVMGMVAPKREAMEKNLLYRDYRFGLDINKKELGAWNSRQMCFQNDPWCGKDQE